MRKTCLDQVYELAKKDRRIFFIGSDLGGGTLHQLIATSIIIFLILIPFFAVRAIAEAVGAEKLARMFFMRSAMLGNKR